MSSPYINLHCLDTTATVRDLRELLLSMEGLDEKWHSVIHTLVDNWRRAEEGEAKMLGMTDVTIDEVERKYLRSAYDAWMAQRQLAVQGSGGMAPAPHRTVGVTQGKGKGKEVNVPTGTREWLARLEVAE